MGKFLRLILIVFIATVLSIGGKQPTGAANQGWLAGWGNRVQLTLDHTKINSTLSDFPVLVHLSSSSGIDKSDVSSVFETLGTDANRRKIAVTAGDGTTQLYVEIERWDTANKQAWLWVKVPSISNQVDTILYLYFDILQSNNLDKVGDTGSIAAQKVWDANYVMVQHMEQAGSATPGLFKDSSSHQHDGTGDHGKIIAAPQSTLSVIGLGQALDNSACITIPDNDDFSVTTTGELTISLWLSESVPNFQSAGLVNVMGKGDVGEYEWSLFMYQRDWTDRSQRVSFYVDNPKGGLGSGSYTQKPVAVNDWVHITAKVDNQYTYIYRNGVLAGKDPYKGPDAYVEIFPQNGGKPVRIGTRDFGTWFQGRIDELRISNVSRSSEYISASYQSDMDNLVRFGAVQNDHPVFNPVGDKFIAAGEPLAFGIQATNRSFKPLTYTTANLPSGASFDAPSKTFSWVPQSIQVGTYLVRFEVTDGVFSDTIDVKITVLETIPVPPEPAANQSTDVQPSDNPSAPEPPPSGQLASGQPPSADQPSEPPAPSLPPVGTSSEPPAVSQPDPSQPVSTPETREDPPGYYSHIHYGWIMMASALLGVLMIATVAAATAMRRGRRGK